MSTEGCGRAHADDHDANAHRMASEDHGQGEFRRFSFDNDLDDQLNKLIILSKGSIACRSTLSRLQSSDFEDPFIDP